MQQTADSDRIRSSMLSIGRCALPQLSSEAFKRSDMTEGLLRIIVSKRYRASSIREAHLYLIRQRLHEFTTANQPLQLYTSIGCYKHPIMPSFPLANWAEMLHIKFMGELLNQVAEFYEPGVVLEYMLSDLGMDRISAVSVAEVEEYAKSFCDIAEFFRPQLLPQAQIKITKLSDIISAAEFERAVESELRVIERNWQDAAQAHAIERSRRNLAGRTVSEHEITQAAKHHAAFLNVEGAMEGQKLSRSICLLHRVDLMKLVATAPYVPYTSPVFLPYRSYSNTVVQFWVGEGCLIRAGARLFPTILSLKQTKSATKLEEFAVDFGLTQNSSLRKIPIYERTYS